MFDTTVDVATLARHFGGERWVVFDCRHALADFSAGKRDYDAGHIPGAFFANVETDLAGTHTGTNGRHPLPDRDAFVAFLRTRGVSAQTQVVAYGGAADMFSPRFWFLMRWIGHRNVAVLDGGWPAWVNGGYPITTQAPRTRSRGTIVAADPLDPTVDADTIARAIGSRSLLLLDARAAERYEGTVEPLDPVAGHIPGARNRWFGSNFDERGYWKSPERLGDELAPFGDPARIVNYCGSGVSAAANMLAFEIAGKTGAHLYPGSWSEWCALRPETVERS